jgi:hypothetical protein
MPRKGAGVRDAVTLADGVEKLVVGYKGELPYKNTWEDVADVDFFENSLSVEGLKCLQAKVPDFNVSFAFLTKAFMMAR